MARSRLVVLFSPLALSSACATEDETRDATSVTIASDSATTGTATGTSAGEGTAEGEGSATSSASAADATSDASAEAGSSGAGSAESGGPGAMYCQLECTVASDCCPAQLPMGVTCPGDYPYGYTCNAEGFCRTEGCSDDEDCTLGGMVTGYECHDVGGFSLCLIVCTTDTDCPGGGTLSCDGEADDATAYCVGQGGGGCTGDEQCGGVGVCEDGACVCHDDGDCTLAGYGCGSW